MDTITKIKSWIKLQLQSWIQFRLVFVEFKSLRLNYNLHLYMAITFLFFCILIGNVVKTFYNYNLFFFATDDILTWNNNQMVIKINILIDKNPWKIFTRFFISIEFFSSAHCNSLPMDSTKKDNMVSTPNFFWIIKSKIKI